MNGANFGLLISSTSSRRIARLNCARYLCGVLGNRQSPGHFRPDSSAAVVLIEENRTSRLGLVYGICTTPRRRYTKRERTGSILGRDGLVWSDVEDGTEETSRERHYNCRYPRNQGDDVSMGPRSSRSDL